MCRLLSNKKLNMLLKHTIAIIVFMWSEPNCFLLIRFLVTYKSLRLYYNFLPMITCLDSTYLGNIMLFLFALIPSLASVQTTPRSLFMQYFLLSQRRACFCSSCRKACFSISFLNSPCLLLSRSVCWPHSATRCWSSTATAFAFWMVERR